MHSSVISISFTSVTVKLVTHDHGPMLLVSVSLGLEEALTLEEKILVLSVTEVFQNFLLICWNFKGA